MGLMKALFERIGLALLSFTLCILLGEVFIRGWYYLGEKQHGTFEEQLQRSKNTTPVAIKDNTSVAGLIQPSPFPDVVYDLKPHLEGIFQGKPVQTNSMGMRDKEYPLAKPPNTFRIVGLGDSVMFGWGVSESESYLEIVEQELNKNGVSDKKFEVLNFAVPGYNTAMEVATFERKAIAFDPDLVVIHFVRNDSEVPLFMSRPKDPFTLRRLYLLEFFAKSYRQLVKKNSDSLLGSALTGLDRADRWDVIDQYRYMIGQDGVRVAMGKLGRLVNERKIPVIVIVSSASEKMKRVIREKIVPRWGFHLVEIQPYVNTYAKEHNIPDTEEDRTKAFRLSAADHHPNVLGHQIYSVALLEQIKKMVRSP